MLLASLLHSPVFIELLMLARRCEASALKQLRFTSGLAPRNPPAHRDPLRMRM